MSVQEVTGINPDDSREIVMTLAGEEYIPFIVKTLNLKDLPLGKDLRMAEAPEWDLQFRKLLRAFIAKTSFMQPAASTAPGELEYFQELPNSDVHTADSCTSELGDLITSTRAKFFPNNDPHHCFVFTSPPWGVLPANQSMSTHSDGEDETNDVAITTTQINSFVNQLTQHLPDDARIVLHLPMNLFRRYIEAMADHNWAVENNPLMVVATKAVYTKFAQANHFLTSSGQTYLAFHKMQHRGHTTRAAALSRGVPPGTLA